MKIDRLIMKLQKAALTNPSMNVFVDIGDIYAKAEDVCINQDGEGGHVCAITITKIY